MDIQVHGIFTLFCLQKGTVLGQDYSSKNSVNYLGQTGLKNSLLLIRHIACLLAPRR